MHSMYNCIVQMDALGLADANLEKKMRFVDTLQAFNWSLN